MQESFFTLSFGPFEDGGSTAGGGGGGGRVQDGAADGSSCSCGFGEIDVLSSRSMVAVKHC